MSAWIEILRLSTTDDLPYPVALYMSAWIEIYEISSTVVGV
ncbi:hypothetical protein [Paenibacillus jamilae]